VRVGRYSGWTLAKECKHGRLSKYMPVNRAISPQKIKFENGDVSSDHCMYIVLRLRRYESII
jgi:hypothetical protein